ncbi:MAG: BamA/TamA family outer membrane protein [Ignavibacteriae bacterium]|nr:BamA/TamA family outer membrane protein [Ignavibacteriota bacterium]
MFRVFTILCFIIFIVTDIYSIEINDSTKVDSTYIKIMQEMTIERIILVGNDKTKDEVILREMQLQEGGKFNLEYLENDVKRLYNLGLFNRVDVVPAPLSSSKINLVFEFEEGFYFLPIPQGGIKEGSLKKIWGGVNFLWKNFRGRNETLNMSFGVGYEPFISVSYLNPWIFGNSHYFFQTSFRYSRTYPRSVGNADSTGVIFNKNEVPTYIMNDMMGDIRIGKYFGKNTSVSALLQFNSIYTSEYQPGRTVSQDGLDVFPTAGLDFTYDTRDYSKFATYGSYYYLKLSRSGLFHKDIDLNKFRFDLRRFIPIKLTNDYALVLSGRINSVLSFGGGEIPVYLKESIGYDNLIRGWDNFVLMGEDKLLGSLELRIPLLKPFYVKGSDHFIIRKVPLANKFSYRYGVYATLFFDLGGVWGRKEQIYDSQFKNGFGAGLNLLLPFDFVARVDFGLRKINKDDFKGQLIMSLDASF